MRRPTLKHAATHCDAIRSVAEFFSVGEGRPRPCLVCLARRTVPSCAPHGFMFTVALLRVATFLAPTETMNVHNEIADRTMRQFRCIGSIHCLPQTQNCDSHCPAGVSIPCKLHGKAQGRKTMRRATSGACGAQRRVHAAGPLREKEAWASRRPLNVEPLPRLGTNFHCLPRFGAARSSTPRKSSHRQHHVKQPQ